MTIRGIEEEELIAWGRLLKSQEMVAAYCHGGRDAASSEGEQDAYESVLTLIQIGSGIPWDNLFPRYLTRRYLGACQKITAINDAARLYKELPNQRWEQHAFLQQKVRAFKRIAAYAGIEFPALGMTQGNSHVGR